MSDGFLASLGRDKAGNALAIFAAALVPLTMLVGSGLDISLAYMARAKLQNACDAGVLAGRQAMAGNTWTDDAEAEADKFFEFNFPEGTQGVENAEFDVEQNEADPAELLGEASGTVPTVLMRIFGFETIPISAACDAKRDMGHNDILLVLDVTGSMLDAPSNGGGTKIGRLRSAAAGLYRAVQPDEDGSVTRYGIVPYSHTVNVGRSLINSDILVNQDYINFRDEDKDVDCDWNSWNDLLNRKCYNTRKVHIKDASWNRNKNGDVHKHRERFRTSGDACIEERSSVGRWSGSITIEQNVTRADVDRRGDSVALQFGRYDPDVQQGQTQSGCPSEARKLRTYADETAFTAAIAATTANPTGGTYHDIGMLWGLRFISRTGFFAADNPNKIDGVTVNQHIVFMTDGMLDTGPTLYSSHGVEWYHERTRGSGTLSQRHIARFNSACSLAKSMGVTVWVIALDVTDTSDVEPCATTSAHFYTSDGSDLETVFENIGQGIGNLRLTR